MWLCCQSLPTALFTTSQETRARQFHSHYSKQSQHSQGNHARPQRTFSNVNVTNLTTACVKSCNRVTTAAPWLSSSVVSGIVQVAWTMILGMWVESSARWSRNGKSARTECNSSCTVHGKFGSPWVAVCMWRRVEMDESRTQSNDRYDGARWCWHLVFILFQ